MNDAKGHPMDSAESAVLAWLGGRGFDAALHGDGYDLIENRVIDSLRFMEFVYLLEQFTGRQILVEGLTLERFRTLAAIRENFLGGVRCDDMEEETL